jgi:hypothetical protein
VRQLVALGGSQGSGNLSALAEETVAAALDRSARAKLAADIGQACRVHDVHLAEYGSLGEAVRAEPDAG